MNKSIVRLYEGALRQTFKHHPRGDRLVDAMCANRLSIDEIDLAFREAEHYGWKWLLDRPRPASGTIRFEVRRKP